MPLILQMIVFRDCRQNSLSLREKFEQIHQKTIGFVKISGEVKIS